MAMFHDSWDLYEARYPKKWIFHPRKRKIAAPLFTLMAAIAVLVVAISHL
jgi:hypothetical protein